MELHVEINSLGFTLSIMQTFYFTAIFNRYPRFIKKVCNTTKCDCDGRTDELLGILIYTKIDRVDGCRVGGWRVHEIMM